MTLARRLFWTLCTTAALAACGGSGGGGGTPAPTPAPPAAVAPTILSHPPDVSIVTGQSADFTVVATGTAPLQYQWMRDSVDIAGATATSYTTPPATLADHGAQYTVRVSNTAGSATSNPARLAVGLPAPMLELVAGTMDGAGYADGPGAVARFATPSGVAVDAQGNLLVADSGNFVVRRVSTTGDVMTIAGTPFSGNLDGPALSARFSLPRSVAFETTTGTAWIADTNNCVFRSVSPAAQVVSLGHGCVPPVGPPVTILQPWNVIANAGGVFGVDVARHVLYTTIPGSPTSTNVILAGAFNQSGTVDGPGGFARLASPTALAFYQGIGFVVAERTGAIRLALNNSTIQTLLPTSSERTNIEGIVVDANGRIYFSSVDRHAIFEYDGVNPVHVLAGSPGERGGADGTGSNARFMQPRGLAFDGAGNLLVADAGNRVIRRVTLAGEVTTVAGSKRSFGSIDASGSAARFLTPGHAAVAANGDVYVGDRGNHTIRRVTPAGQVTTFAGQAGVPGSADGVGTAAQFNSPWGVYFDATGNLYIADSGNHTIRRIAPDGTVSTIAGLAGSPGFDDGVGAAARFRSPGGIAVDANGVIWIADASNHTIRRMTTAGDVTTHAGAAGLSGSTNGARLAARFTLPHGIEADAAGNLFVLERHHIRRIDSNGDVTDFSGGQAAGFADGIAADARFNDPAAITMDRATRVLYVVDSRNYRIRKVLPDGAVSTIVGTAGAGRFIPGPLPGAIPFGYGAAFSNGALYVIAEDGVARVTRVP